MTDRTYSESKFLENYDAAAYDRPSATVDTVIFTVIDDALHVLLVKRNEHPFKDKWSLVGGFIDLQLDKDLEATAKRKLEEKTSVKTPYLEQYATIGNAERDPRGWFITTVYFALIPSEKITLQAGTGASEVKWAKVTNGQIEEDLAFDHNALLNGCFERLRSKVLYTSLPVYLMPSEFTLGELQKTYEVVLGMQVERKSFRRRILSTDIIEETGKMKQTGRRPAALFSLKKELKTHFFVRNIEGAS